MEGPRAGVLRRTNTSLVILCNMPMNRNIGSHAVYEKCVDIIEEDVCRGTETLHSKLDTGH